LWREFFIPDKAPAKFDVGTFVYETVPAWTLRFPTSRTWGSVSTATAYSPRLMRHLGLKEESGAVRVSLVHCHAIAEIERFGLVLEQVAGS
jgi:hypothetical protein